MQLSATELLRSLESDLLKDRQQLSVTPGLALIWVGVDEQTAAFIRAKQAKAKKLDCHFSLHHFQHAASAEQIVALIKGLNQRKDIHGIVLQLPLPKAWPVEKLIETIDTAKDVDSLKVETKLPDPTPAGIIALLESNALNLATSQTVILGAGKLVGKPLAEIFARHNWPCRQISTEAEKHAAEIKKADVLISCTGITGLVTADMVHEQMIVVDGSGVDVDVDTIEPLVKAVTPKRGAIGPLTVHYLFKNLLAAAKKD